jgi:hypothetical protein
VAYSLQKKEIKQKVIHQFKTAKEGRIQDGWYLGHLVKVQSVQRKK